MKFVLFACTCVLLLGNLSAAAVNGLDEAQKLYVAADYPAAANRLQNATDAPSLRLLGRSYLMMSDLTRASDTLERAVDLDPQNSEGYMLLGRAYGLRAQNATLSAAPLAIKTRINFEKAYSLDPKNWDAASDLFEFYLQAPAFMGGGLDKASKLADAIAVHDRVEAAVDRARVAERRKDYPAAEQLFRSAVKLAPQQANTHVEFARFLAHRNRYADSDAEFAQAFQSAPNSAATLYARADVLIQTNRNLPEARQLLNRVLSLKLGPDDPSRQSAEKLLHKVS